MGFWDTIMGLGKSASNAAAESVKKHNFNVWNKIKSSPIERINDFYNQNNTPEHNRPACRGLAIAALYSRGDWGYERLWREDQYAANWLKDFRVKISLDTCDSADELRKIIDRLTEQY
ncbi:hypothetical protein RCO08_03075 [Escherichia coli]|uniref:hypothetical protein n=1 Tax=Escherichia marmotae TaxID=1499973 RepID=UPI0023B23FB0|nr:hypothetical protein [Escherichia marmotae]MDE9780082.1 hypothetical protein [Escherichia marmotae]MED0220402.1 hypothetical protein [Escherichia coli]MED9705914.1 hypothetical protein [Escherichia coli]